jgi:transportin-3
LLQIHSQVQRDYEELPPDAVPQLRDSLMTLLFKFGTGSSPAVRTQLCLAIAALSAHLPAGQWGEGGVLRWLMNKFSGQDPAMAMSCMLELLTVLPQVGGVCVHAAAAAACGRGGGQCWTQY